MILQKVAEIIAQIVIRELSAEAEKLLEKHKETETKADIANKSTDIQKALACSQFASSGGNWSQPFQEIRQEYKL
jgi:hypothetical protein